MAANWRPVIKSASVMVLLATPAQAAVITFTNVNDPPTVLLNQLSIHEGESVIITSNQLQIMDPDNTPIELSIQADNVEHGYFERIFSVGSPIDSFTYQDVQFGFIRFVHDGGEIAPSYSLQVSDGQATTDPQPAIITFTPINDAPVLVVNQLTLTEGDTLILSNSS